MDRFSALEMLIRCGESGSFAAVAKQLGVTSVAVGKQISKLEKTLGVQLVVRTTRQTALTEAGQRLVAEARAGVMQVKTALSAVNQVDAGLSGSLRVSCASTFGRQYVLPLLGPFAEANPNLTIDLQFENRQVNLIADGFDACIGGAVTLSGGLSARSLAPLHLVVFTSRAYLEKSGMALPERPEELMRHTMVAMRSPTTGRIRPWNLSSAKEQISLVPEARILLNDPEAIKEAVLAGMGIGLTGYSHVLPYLKSGELVRLLPDWYEDTGNISIYFQPSRLLPRKTRGFIDFLSREFEERGIAQKLSAKPARKA